MSTTFIDLDEVVAETEMTLKLNGKEHKMRQTDVETFVQNLKDLDKLGLNATMVEEVETTVAIVQRAFPTITPAELRKLTLPQLKKISDAARGVSGEITTTDPQEKAEAEATGKSQKAA